MCTLLKNLTHDLADITAHRMLNIVPATFGARAWNALVQHYVLCQNTSID